MLVLEPSTVFLVAPGLAVLAAEGGCGEHSDFAGKRCAWLEGCGVASVEQSIQPTEVKLHGFYDGHRDEFAKMLKKLGHETEGWGVVVPWYHEDCSENPGEARWIRGPKYERLSCPKCNRPLSKEACELIWLCECNVKLTPG